MSTNLLLIIGIILSIIAAFYGGIDLGKTGKLSLISFWPIAGLLVFGVTTALVFTKN